METLRFEGEGYWLTEFSGVSVDAVADYFLRNQFHLAASMPAREPSFHAPAFWKGQQARYGHARTQGTELRFFLLQAGHVIGHVGFDQIVRGPFQACYLAYGIDREFEGQGLMRKALAKALEHVFGELKLNRVMANYAPDNFRSGRLLESLGFEREGYARRYLKLNGQWQDHILTSLVADQYIPG